MQYAFSHYDLLVLVQVLDCGRLFQFRKRVDVCLLVISSQAHTNNG